MAGEDFIKLRNGVFNFGGAVHGFISDAIGRQRRFFQ